MINMNRVVIATSDVDENMRTISKCSDESVPA
jgi:hypothetical protein